MKIVLILSGLFLLTPVKLFAHCQLPCGIYHDDLEFALLEEGVQTINKAISEIKANSIGRSSVENNQLVRSVNLKDEYADKIAHIMSFYFLQQRLSKSQKNFPSMLQSAFDVLQLCAEVKASTDSKLVSELQDAISNFEKLYKQKD